MTNEFSQKILEILESIQRAVKPDPFWLDFSLWSTVVLAITLFWLIKYTRATERMAVYQTTPAIDVNMCYDEDSKKTYFWFLNSSNLPGIVRLRHKKNNESTKDTHTPLRVPPGMKMKTAVANFNLSPSDGDEIILYVTVTPAIDKSKIKIKFEKSYKFSENKWLENSWNFPDPPYDRL
ncbi:MAG: hypothetical protein WC545_01850 [Patescibacteria group bacterium]|jgi:hypothetical protein